LHFFILPVIVTEETNPFARDRKAKEEITRRLLHLAALSLVTMFLFVPTTWAQGDAGAQDCLALWAAALINAAAGLAERIPVPIRSTTGRCYLRLMPRLARKRAKCRGQHE